MKDLARELERNPAFKAYFYADDLAILTKGKVNIKKAVEDIENWCRRNKMIINHKKCGIMKLHGNQI